LLVGGEGAVQDITLKNTVMELYYDHERTALAVLPCRLKALTASGELSRLPRMPESLEHLKLIVAAPTACENGLNTSSWNCPLTDRLSHLRNLTYLAVNCRHLTSREVKRVVEFARQNNLRMLVLLSI